MNTSVGLRPAVDLGELTGSHSFIEYLKLSVCFGVFFVINRLHVGLLVAALTVFTYARNQLPGGNQVTQEMWRFTGTSNLITVTHDGEIAFRIEKRIGSPGHGTAFNAEQEFKLFVTAFI